MTVRVVSLCWGTAWERYGRTFAQTFADNWPADVELVIVTDRFIGLPRGKQAPLELISGYRAFLDRWSSDMAAMGHRAPQGTKTNENGYSWRHDAVKWMPQALAPIPGIEGLEDGDIFVWFDADTETTSKVPARWIESLLGDADVACIRRPGRHTEIGFYAMRMGPGTRRVLRLFADFYLNDSVFKLTEWHSAFVWDRALETEPELRVHDLNPTGARGHAWPKTTMLADKTLHHKGKRKDS